MKVFRLTKRKLRWQKTFQKGRDPVVPAFSFAVKKKTDPSHTGKNLFCQASAPDAGANTVCNLRMARRYICLQHSAV